MDRPMRGNIYTGIKTNFKNEWMANITEWTGMIYEYIVRLAQDRDQRRVMKKTALHDGDEVG